MKQSFGTTSATWLWTLGSLGSFRSEQTEHTCARLAGEKSAIGGVKGRSRLSFHSGVSPSYTFVRFLHRRRFQTCLQCGSPLPASPCFYSCIYSTRCRRRNQFRQWAMVDMQFRREGGGKRKSNMKCARQKRSKLQRPMKRTPCFGDN